MSEKPQEYPTAGLDATGEYFTINAPLHAVRPGYISRRADDALFETLVAGRFAHVIAPNRTGKSSLIAATSARLQNNGYRVAVLDLAQISERDGGSDAGRWYYSFAYRLLRQLRLKVDLQEWWQDKSILSNRQRLVEFYAEIILEKISEPIIVFIDEIQCIVDRPFAEHLLASFREAQNSRITEPDFLRLSFVLAGECDPLSLVSNAALSPFAVSQEIRLGDFSRDDLEAFSMELNLSRSDAAIALDRVYYWTSGHPYLSQKLSRAIARERISGNIKEHVDRIAMHQLAGRAALHSEPHMSHVHRRVVTDRKNSEALLNIYGRLRKGIVVGYEPESRHQRMLLAIGLVVADENGRLRVRNRLYKAVFTARWANENLPLHWRGPAIAALVLLAATAVPFWYTQLLPKPYMRAMSSSTLGLEAANDAYTNLSSFPGHADSAERLFRFQLEARAAHAPDVAAMRQIESFARRLPDSEQFADNLLADFWDRQVDKAARLENRDEALIAALESLVMSTPERRRRAASLIGDDYSLLLGTIPPQNANRLLFEPEGRIMSYVTGAEVRQWSLADEVLEPRQQWIMSALEITPLVRRLLVDRAGRVERLGVTLNIGHARLDDLRIKLIAPSGRTAELAVEVPATVSNDVVRFDRRQLSLLIGEPLNGSWTLSIRDEASGVGGILRGWELSLNSQVAVESFERGLEIPEPVARESDDLWFDPDGRYAIARARQSDSARLWDLGYGRAARTIAVPASEQVLGLANSAELLVTLAQNSLQLWRTSDGRPYDVLETGSGSFRPMLSEDGEHVLLMHRGDTNTDFRLWSLASGRIVARLSVAGAPALVAMDASGRHLAVADYDRAVRIWNLRSGKLLSQMALLEQPSSIQLSANGNTLGVVHGESGFSLWQTIAPQQPLVSERGPGNWHLAFSPSGARVIAGNSQQGFQVYRSADGRLSGPALDSDLRPGTRKVVAFSAEEDVVVTGDPGDKTRLWRAPPPVIAVASRATGVPGRGHELWRQGGGAVSAIDPAGSRIAVGDSQGHVHFLTVDVAGAELEAAAEAINYLGHRDAVVALAFSNDGALVASAGATGTVRIWDTESGLPRPYSAGGLASSVERMHFSPASSRLAVLSGRRVWVMDVVDGDVLIDMELGERHTDIAFADEDRLYLGGESGMLRVLATDRAGGWNLRNVWAGSAPLVRIAVSPQGQKLALIDSANTARLLDLQNGRIGTSELQLPQAARHVVFSPGESRVLIHTAGWIHRARVSLSGLGWLDSSRAPTPMHGSTLVFDAAAGQARAGDPLGNRVLLLTRDAGFAELAVVDFSFASGPTVFGSHEELLGEWRTRLGMNLATGLLFQSTVAPAQGSNQ
jgi:WD40 repeat protein